VAEKFDVILTQRWVLPLAVAVAALGSGLASSWWARALFGAVALAAALAAAWQWRARPRLVVDERGYAVEEHGREKLRVAWTEVVKVLADAEEHALYVDCGDKTRNLLVPPRRGFGVRFARADVLYARVLEAVPDRVELVKRLDDAAVKPEKA
jgi:hypothetical protein